MSDTLLVHLDASPRCAVRLQIARQLGHALKAEVAALYAVTSALSRYPMAMAAGADMAPLLIEVDDQRLAAARALFAQAVPDGSVAWRRGYEQPVRDTVRHALYADLLVLGQRGPDADADIDVPADFVASVILGSGRPALVVPHIATPDWAGRRALVAWKETRESARAVSAALPLLRMADSVQVVCFDEPRADEAPVDGLPGIEAWLGAHGVKATVLHEPAPAHDLGEVLLSLAADQRSDLLVMGCYGHGRAREWALGGVTRTVLGAMTLPVLMAH